VARPAGLRNDTGRISNDGARPMTRPTTPTVTEAVRGRPRVATRNRSRPAGSSVCDIVVLVAAVGLLLAIFLSCRTRVRQQAQLLTCMNNLKQMGAMLQAYARDH